LCPLNAPEQRRSRSRLRNFFLVISETYRIFSDISSIVPVGTAIVLRKRHYRPQAMNGTP
jgi:hypothetical protein